MENHEQDIYDLGLAADLEMLRRSPIDRRRILKLGVAGIGLLLAACDSALAQTSEGGTTYLPSVANGVTETPTSAPTATTAPTVTATPTATLSPTECVTEIPEEIAGPYPADGSRASSQTLNILTESGIVRSDIRTSLGTGNTAQGIPCTIELTLVDSSGDCLPLAEYALYLWHCDRGGNYSLYSTGVTNEDYLRGVQVADSNGKVTFTTIFPACYSGRWPHVHFEIYSSLEKATTASNAIHTSQLALPEDVCNVVYATSGYERSVQNLSQLSLETDNIFSDGYSTQMATVTGDVTNGYMVQLTVGVDV